MSNATVLVVATWAVIDSVTNIVVNRVWWDGESTNPDDQWTPPEGTYVVKVDDPAAGGIGQIYDPETKTFSWPPESTEESAS